MECKLPRVPENAPGLIYRIRGLMTGLHPWEESSILCCKDPGRYGTPERKKFIVARCQCRRSVVRITNETD